MSITKTSGPYSRSYYLADEPADLAWVLDRFKFAGQVSIDTETTSLDVHAPEFALVGLVLSWSKHEGVYLPVGHEGFAGLSTPRNLSLEAVTELLEDLLINQGLEPIYHNGAYDRQVLKKAMDLDFDDTYGQDTILAAHLDNENLAKNLKSQARAHLGIHEAAPAAAMIDRTWLEKSLVESFGHTVRDKKGVPLTKQAYRAHPQWVEKLTTYYTSFARGATPYSFVMQLMSRAFTAMKKRKVDGVDFKGPWSGDFRYVPPSIAVMYAVDDAINTFALWQHFQATTFWVEPDLWKLYRDIELPANDVMMRASYRGMLANKKHLQEMKSTLARRAEEFRDDALKSFRKIVKKAPPSDPDAFNEETLLTSNQQLALLLYDQVGFPVLQKTKAGAASASKQVLSKLLHKDGKTPGLTELGHEFIQAKLKFQDVAKLESTYTDSLIDKIDENGRIHAQYNTVGTVSGRMSSNSPNFQQMPRLTPEEVAKKPWLYGIDVRAAFHADPDYVFVAADWSSMEMVGAAAIAQDLALMELLDKGKDLHVHTARNAMRVVYSHLSDQHFKDELGLSREEFDALEDPEFTKRFKLWRQDAKVVNFAMTYAGTWWTLHKSFDFPEEKAKMMEEGFKRAYPQLVAKMEAVFKELDDRGFITYPEYGFVKHMDLPPRAMAKKDPRGYQRQVEAAKRTCFNALIQGYCAYIAKEALVKTHRQLQDEGIDAWVSHQIHDELGLQVHVTQAEQAGGILLENMRRMVEGVFLDADLEMKFTMSKAEPSLDIEALTSTTTSAEGMRYGAIKDLTHDAAEHENESLDDIQHDHAPVARHLGEYVGIGVREVGR